MISALFRQRFRARKIIFAILGSAGLLFCPITLSAQNPAFITITNPAPVGNDRFGFAVAPLSASHVIIGAYWKTAPVARSGAAYLYDLSGKLVTTMTNPTPAADDYFGTSVAALGADRVIVGAIGEQGPITNSTGAVYLYNTNGTLLVTINNPSLQANAAFGNAVAALGTDKILAGAYQYDAGATNAGAVYVFNTNGMLLTTINNPTPGDSDMFGWSLKVVGTDKVLIGAYQDDTGATDAGAAYLFNVNGTLLTTFTNPAPAVLDRFGYALATLSPDRVVIGSHRHDTGATDAGVAYLYNINGTLLTTFTNPAPANADNFGLDVGTISADKIVIAASPHNTGGLMQSGIVYVFNTNGNLLNTITNPKPATFVFFGNAVAGLGTDKLIVGAYMDNTGAFDAGLAYVFDLGPPALRIAQTSPGSLVVAWPTSSIGFNLSSTTNLTGPSWASVTNTITVVGTENQITIPTANSKRFFRLSAP
jgi:hypothetical protein